MNRTWNAKRNGMALRREAACARREQVPENRCRCRWLRLSSSMIAALLISVATPSHAVIQEKEIAVATNRKVKREVKGRQPTGAPGQPAGPEHAILEEAIQALRDLEAQAKAKGDAKQAAELKTAHETLADMLSKGRICIETNAETIKKVYGITVAADRAMNIDPGLLADAANFSQLVATLAHESRHVTQTETDPTQREREALTFGEDVLKKLKALPPPIDRIKRIKAGLKDPQVTFGTDTYYVVPQLAGVIFSFTPTDVVTSEFPLAFGDPLDLTAVSDVHPSPGSSVVAASGNVVHDDTQGRIQYLEVQDGRVLRSLGNLTIPNSRPQSLVYDPVRDLLFVLDVFNQRILLIRDTDGDQLPDTLVSTPYATVRRLQSILGNPAGDGFDLVGSELDRRGAPDELFLNERLLALFDVNNDGVADETYPLFTRDIVAVQPDIEGTPRHGQAYGWIVATAGAEIEVQAVDPSGPIVLEVLARRRLRPSEHRILTHFSRPLREGEFIRIVDLTTPLDGAPAIVLVKGPGPRCEITRRGTDPMGNWFVEFTIQDLQTGLAAINVVTSTNVTVVVPPFLVGTKAPVVVRATRIDPTSIPKVELEAVDLGGNATRCR